MKGATKAQVRRWQAIPYEPLEHRDHDRIPTKAHYDEGDGGFRVCYCYDCGDHFRLAESEYERRDGWHNPRYDAEESEA